MNSDQVYLSSGMFSVRWRRLFHAFDKIVRCHVRSRTGWPGAFLWPGEMAILTVEFLVHRADVCEKTDEQIWQRGFVGILRIFDAQGLAFRATNRSAQSAFSGITIKQQLVSQLEPIR